MYNSSQKVRLWGEFSIPIDEVVPMLWIKVTHFHIFKKKFCLRLSGGTNTHSTSTPFKISEELLGFY